MEVVHGSPQLIWVDVNPAGTVFVGDLTMWDTSAFATNEGILGYHQADGVENLSNLDCPFGIIVGTNEKSPRFNTTAKAEYSTAAAAADPHDGATREYVLTEGGYSKGHQWAQVQVAIVTPSTIIRAPIYNNAVGTAPSLLTATAGSTSGLQATHNSCDFTPVAGMCTIYCRKGGNAGMYRVTSDTSKTTTTWDVAMPKDTVAGDTFVKVPLRIGPSYVRIGDDTYSSYINCSEKPATNYQTIHVIKLDLREAGKEYCEFFFAPSAFVPYNIFATT